ncbi:DUF5516 domain-containing protein [Desulfotalea psychrophila]
MKGGGGLTAEALWTLAVIVKDIIRKFPSSQWLHSLFC